MTEPSDRPDPDTLLRRISADEARKRRARLKVFFGFAPGVGKTYRMLQVARDLVIEQRLDVVVGLVETHRRSETASMLLGLDILPRRKIEYRGQMLEEFDLDAALARKPKLLLLDELAHTNVPGLRHAKRWQDVMELLDAGIDVFTTVNVQHVESLNDVVAQITQVRVRETVPDSILDRADEIELVDIAPEELLARLREGKVYMPEQAQRAAEHFFQRGNLLALRELALRRTAQQVDVAVEEYRERFGVTGTWAASERILVCVGPAPSSARLIRAARRMAAGLRAPWVAVYVESTALGGISEVDRERLETHLRLAESLGGTVARLSGTRVAEVVLGYARKQNVTHIVVGKPTHSRVRDRLSGSLLDDIVRGSADIDVHVISGDPLDEREARGAPPPRPFRPGPYASAALVVAATTAAAKAMRAVFPVPDIEVLYLLAVMIAAFRYGRGPSIAAAAIAVAAYDFFFVPPYYRFAVADARYFLTFAMLFGVGIVVSELASRIRRQEQDALQREAHTAALYALSRDLVAAEDARGAADAIARHATEVFEAAVFVLLPGEGGVLSVVVSSPPAATLDAKELGVARWAYEHGQSAGLGTETLPGSKTVCTPLRVAGTLGVLALEPRSGEALGAEQREFLGAFCRQAAFALERARLSDEARNAALRAKTEEMRSSLLSAVSHDLRTPLATITGAATSLRDGHAGMPPETRADMLEAICEEAERLERLVANLLDMTRLESGAVALKRDWVPVEEIVGSALTRVDRRLSERPVQISLPDGLPLVSVDPVLFEQVLLNLFDNAAKYTPAGSPLEIKASSDGRAVTIELNDRGPGLPPGNEQRVFEKFYRGGQAGIRGVGLGLPICKAIVEAHGGTIDAENRIGGGARFRVTIPLTGNAPALSEIEAAHA